jgi:putative ABC transport system permease protein
MNDVPACAWRELKRRRSRTLANVLGYLLSVGMMVVLVSVLFNSKEESDAILNNTGTHFIAFLPVGTAACPSCAKPGSLFGDEGFVANGIPTGLIPLDFVQEVLNLPTVKDAAPFLLFQFRDPGDGRLFTVGGLPPDHAVAIGNTSCAQADVVDGRFLGNNDSGKVMAEEAYARTKGLKANDPLKIMGASFIVTGIVNAGVRPAKADLYMTFDDAERLINLRIEADSIESLRGGIRRAGAGGSPPPVMIFRGCGAGAIRKQANLLLVEAKNAKVQDEAVQSIKGLFPSLVFSGYSCYRPAAKVMGLTENSVWLLTLVIAICTVILSLKSQFSSVLERRREIGILKSIGWSDRNVVSQIVCESVLQATIGGILGCCAAAVLMLTTPLRSPGGGLGSNHGPAAMLIFGAGFSLSLMGGLIAGIFPAFFAARRQPADALKSL